MSLNVIRAEVAVQREEVIPWVYQGPSSVGQISSDTLRRNSAVYREALYERSHTSVVYSRIVPTVVPWRKSLSTISSHVKHQVIFLP